MSRDYDPKKKSKPISVEKICINLPHDVVENDGAICIESNLKQKKTIVLCVIATANTTKYSTVKLKLTYRYPFVIQPSTNEATVSLHPE